MPDATVIGEALVPQKRGLPRRIWRRWLRIAHVIGTVQMLVVLTVVYWTILALTAVLFRLFGERLTKPPAWYHRAPPRQPAGPTLDEMKKQY